MGKLILAVPLVLVLLSVTAAISSVLSSWQLAILVLLIAGLLNWKYCAFAIHYDCKEPEAHDFRVMTFNVNRAYTISSNTGSSERLVDFIIRQNADIVLLQEYNAELYPVVQNRLAKRYPYSSEREGNSRFKSVYSRFPIKCSGQLMVDAQDPQYELFQNKYYCKKTDNGAEIMPVGQLEIEVSGQPVQIFNCHLMSNNYSVVIRNLRKKNKSILRGVMEIWKRIGFGSHAREVQARIICGHIAPEIPTLVCGDFNDVSGSPALCVFQRKEFVDAWWRKGFGFGFTFHGMGMRFRLDHVLYDPKELILTKVFVPHSDVSDHDPVICDFRFC